MIDADEPAEKNRVPIRGWLLVYAIGPMGLGVLAALDEVAQLFRYGGDDIEWLLGFFLFIVYSTALYMLIAVRRRFTRIYHMGLTGLMAVALAAIAYSTADPVAAGACAGMSAWMIYWYRSQRVQKTYCS
jgi:hypothetical protein